MFSKREAQSRPSGLVVPMRAGVKGTLMWQVRDEEGRPEVARNEGGFPLAPAEGITQHNLLTDLGLDDIGTSSVLSPNFRNYFHIGEGSTPPQFTDTMLDAEVQRGATVGQQPAPINYFYDSLNECFVAEIRVSRALTMSANRNLTEFGFGGANNALVRIRELFRDGSGNPVVISLLNGKVIDVLHTLRLEIAAPTTPASGQLNVDRYDAANQLISSTPYDYVYGPSCTPGGQIDRVFGAWDPVANPGNRYFGVFSAPGSYAPVGPRPSMPTPTATGVSKDPYVPGSHESVNRQVIGTGFANGDIFGLIALNFTEGFVAYFTSPASFTKNNTETLSVSFISQWARL